MVKRKLEKFAELSAFQNVIQPTFEDVWKKDFHLKGKWHTKYFKNNNDIVLEIGCGKGEYTLFLAKKYINKNFIGIDIKGARIWKGAKIALQEHMSNVVFLRMRVEHLSSVFIKNEVSEIWIPFPDPQMKKVRKRLVSANILSIYQQFLKENGCIHVKTDSRFLFTYMKLLLHENNIKPNYANSDVYKNTSLDEIINIETHYEKQFSNRGIPIKYIQFELPYKELFEPKVKIEFDSWKSYGRNRKI